MTKKQATAAVSSAADNTRVLKRTKNVIKLVVTGVKINGEIRKVKFAARNERGGFVVCRTAGKAPIRVRAWSDGRGITYDASVRGNSVCESAKDPSKAFALGVKAFWA